MKLNLKKLELLPYDKLMEKLETIVLSNEDENFNLPQLLKDNEGLKELINAAMETEDINDIHKHNDEQLDKAFQELANLRIGATEETKKELDALEEKSLKKYKKEYQRYLNRKVKM